MKSDAIQVSTWLESMIRQDFDGNLAAMLEHVTKLENKLASGSRASVYTLPSTNNYVLRVSKGISPFQFGIDEWLALDDPLPEKNIGQAVIESPCQSLQILRYQAGITYSVDYSTLFSQYDIDAVLGLGQPVLAEDIAPSIESYRQHLTLIARMPQEAFDDLALTIQLLTEHDLHFDPCSKNILVDTEAEYFNTVDHDEYVGPYANVLGMACALMDTIFLDLDEHAIDATGALASVGLHKDPALMALRKRILTRILQASSETGLPISPEACPENVFGYRQRSFDMAYVMRVSGLGNTELSALL